MAVNGKDACYVMACFFFFWGGGGGPPSTVNAAILLDLLHDFIIAWPSPGTVKCLLLCLHVLSR